MRQNGGSIVSNSIEKYLKEIKEELHLNANWVPTTSINLGDYGTMENNIFNRVGNITDEFKIPIETINGTKGDYVHTSKNKVELLNKLSASASEESTGKISVDYEMKFLTSAGFLFQALDSSQSEIKNLRQVGDAILKKYKQGKWESNYVVVTKYIQAPKTTIMIFKDENASVIISANGSTNNTDLLHSNVEFGFKCENDMAFKFISEEDIKPLIGLHRINFNFFGDDKFKPMINSEFFRKSFNFIIPNFRNLKYGRSTKKSQMVYNVNSINGRKIMLKVDKANLTRVYKNTALNQSILKESYRRQALLFRKAGIRVDESIMVGEQAYKVIQPSYNEIKSVINKMNGKEHLLAATIFSEVKKDERSRFTPKRTYAVATFETV